MEIAVQVGLRVVAITDHDTMSGYEEALEQIPEELIVVPAVELSTAHKDAELHILGYFVDHKNAAFTGRIRQFRQERVLRGEKIVEKLNELGVELSMDTVRRVAGDSALGRPHVADALVEQEFVRTFNEAFARYLGYHAPAYVPKYHITPEEAIRFVHEAGGVAVLAHPGTLGCDEVIPDLARAGLDGIEAIYPLHSYHATKKYMQIAGELELIVTGGSDCHGRSDGRTAIGSVSVPRKCYDDLLSTKDKYRS
jgi:predicted metal-dependent phosphoesterase TrpH